MRCGPEGLCGVGAVGWSEGWVQVEVRVYFHLAELTHSLHLHVGKRVVWLETDSMGSTNLAALIRPLAVAKAVALSFELVEWFYFHHLGPESY